ncbi:MAG: hypothetical protein H7061_04305 [Bdellovibrionaceae bacterium]|nr:hypothetical protein [Bdellovibrio sp.]
MAALAFFIYNDPLRDECEVQAKIFENHTKGILTAEKIKGRTQFPKIEYWRDLCRDGNSEGACEDYFSGLKITTQAVGSMNEKCQLTYAQKNPDLLTQVSQAIQIMALIAWGEKPPEGLSNRLGWLTESHLKTFCSLKRFYQLAAGEENFLPLREKVYNMFPAPWPEKIPIEGRTPENRPKAYKTVANPDGIFPKEKIYERSLFSIRCDLYL